jgi:hypothetical protein
MPSINSLRSWLLLGIALLAGCGSHEKSGGNGSAAALSNLGVIGRVDSPSDVAAVRTFYVAPNNQLCMKSDFVAGSPLHQVFAERIAERLTSRGLTQAPQDMADATVTFIVQDPAQSPVSSTGDSQGLAYADQLLAEANAMSSKDNFLQNDRVDLRVKMTSNKTQQPIWRGSIAGVLSASHGPRGRLIDLLAAVDKLFDQYPKVK